MKDKNGFASRVLLVLFMVATIVGAAWFVDDRVEAKVRALETRLQPEINQAHENAKTLIRIEEQMKTLNQRQKNIEELLK